MSGDKSTTTLSAKEIKRLKQSVKYHKWVLPAFGLFALVMLGCAARAWSEASKLGFPDNFEMNRMYSGVEIRAASLAGDAFVYWLSAVLVVGWYFVFKSIHRKNVILLNYVERDNHRASEISN